MYDYMTKQCTRLQIVHLTAKTLGGHCLNMLNFNFNVFFVVVGEGGGGGGGGASAAHSGASPSSHLYLLL